VAGRHGTCDRTGEVVIVAFAGSSSSSSSAPFELQTLAALPCGCIVADYRAHVLDVDLVSLEAKGPHCMHPGHAAGGVLGLGDSLDLGADEMTTPAA
jgi:hypothetical protein